MNVTMSDKAKKLLSNRNIAVKILLSIIHNEHKLNNGESIFVKIKTP